MNGRIFYAPLQLNKNPVLSLFGSSIAGMAIYLILSSAHLVTSITVPLCILITLIVYGLSNFYLKTEKKYDVKPLTSRDYNFSIPFLGLYVSVILLLIIPFPSEPNLRIFMPWNMLTAMDLVKLGASVVMIFFLPGYATVISVLRPKVRLSSLLKVLLGYLLSVFIAGTTLYSTSILGLTISESNLILVLIYFTILILFILAHFQVPIRTYAATLSISGFLSRMLSFFGTHFWQCIVFSGITGLIIFSSTYILYDGIIIGDQWFHHGRALSYLTNTYKDFFDNNVDDLYSPLLPGVLSSLFFLSSVPSVNAYASIAFLNVLPALAYCFFFVQWVPSKMKPAALLATVFLVLGSGFGWIDVLAMSISDPPSDERGALMDINTVSIQANDIRTPSTFFLAGKPESSTGLPLIALPAGFVLLGLINLNLYDSHTKKNKGIAFVILTIITLLGILSHDEFYIFIIVSSIVPILLNLRNKTILYLSLTSSMSIILLINALSPTPYFTGIWLFGLPLITLVLIFVILTGIIYASGAFALIHNTVTDRLKQLFPASSGTSNSKLYVILLILIINVAYWYAIGLILWQDSTVQSILAAEADEKDIPWFVYPMKLGVLGILGSAYLLSYFFKRFEKEIFIFGIIILVAFLVGSYYDEHRFSKYVIAGMSGFAGLLVYQLVIKFRNILVNPLVTSLFISVLVVSCSTSVIMYVAWKALANDTGNSDLEATRRRNLPTASELRLLNFLQPHGPINQSYNIATLSKEYEDRMTLTSYFQAFSALPTGTVLKTPYLLNSTSLENFYNQLEENDVKYLVLTKKEINSTNSIPYAVLFAISNFQIAYEDENYTVLDVPNLRHSNPKSETTLVYQHNPLSHLKLIQNSTLYFNKTYFEFPDNTKVVEGGTSGELMLNGASTGETTLWSKDMQGRQINYIEADFKTLNENGGHCGIVWKDTGNKSYYARLGIENLQFSETPRSDATTIVEAQTGSIETMKWYTIKLLFIDGVLRLFLDDIFIFETPLDNNESIKNVGIRCQNNVAEFDAMVIGRIPDSAFSYHKAMYSNYYYPLSALALSDIDYDTLVLGDQSVSSIKNIILTSGTLKGANLDMYLESAEKGANLYIINPDSSFASNIRQLFAMQYENMSGYDNISDIAIRKPTVDIQGNTNSIQTSSGNIHEYTRSVYIDDGEVVAPFSIQKNHGNGTVTLINAGRYFESILKNPREKFGSLSEFTRLIGINSTEHIKENSINPVYPIRFVGEMRIDGPVTINSSSVDLGVDDNQSSLFVNKVSIIDEDKPAVDTILENVNITNLELEGEYEVIINGNGRSSLPLSLSFEDYATLSIQQGFNMTIKLQNTSGVHLVTKNADYDTTIVGKTIRFYGVEKNMPNSKHFMVTMKSPGITVLGGNSSFDRLYVGEFDPWLRGNPLGQSTVLNGNLTAKIGHIDVIDVGSRDVDRQKMRYITFLTSIDHNQWDKINISPSLKIPGEIPEDLEKTNIDLVLKRILVSEIGILVLVLIASITIILAYLYRRRKIHYLKP